MSNNTPKKTDENGRDIKGRFTQGNKGKPKGATNTHTRELKQFITDFLNDKTYELPHIWNTLEDKDKATLFLHLSRLVLPKPSQVDPSEKEEPRIFNIDVPEIIIKETLEELEPLTAEKARENAKKYYELIETDDSELTKEHYYLKHYYLEVSKKLEDMI